MALTNRNARAHCRAREIPMRHRTVAGFLSRRALVAGAWLAAACSSDQIGAVPAPSSEAGSTADSDATAPTDATYERVPYDGTSPPPLQRVPVQAEMVSNRVDAQSLLFAAGEMQISGEPFARDFAGRNLNYYDRNYVPP